MRLPYTNVRVSVCEIVIALLILETTAKSVQTTAEVCADYTCSLYRLQLKSPESTTYLLKCLRVLTDVSTRTYRSEYVVLTNVFMRRYFSSFALLTPSRMLYRF